MNDRIKIHPHFVRNTDQIVSYVKKHCATKFKPRIGDDRHTGIIPKVYSDFHTLKDVDMDKQLIDLIFSDNDFDPDLKDFYNFIQIQRYMPGQFICPHYDQYSIRKLHLITLTTSDYDGLYIEDGSGSIKFAPDVAGQYIDFDNSLIHWVGPVREERYSMVIGE